MIPAWDGALRFESDCVVNGEAVKAGTVIYVLMVPFRWNPNTSSMEPYAHTDDLKR